MNMNNESILTAVSEWATSKGLDYDVAILSAPPALLDLRTLLSPGELPPDSSGVCLTVRTPSGAEFEGQLGFWLPAMGKGSWSSLSESDSEIGTSWIPEFHEERELITFVNAQVEDFLAAA
jgi:hypothetical protein